MDHGDLFGTLRWGLRHYAWLIVLFAVSVGVALPFAQSQRPNVYEARALVTFSGADFLAPSIDVVPRAAERVFTDDPAVAGRAREVLGLPASAPVIPDKIDLVAEQDNVVFTVIGRDDDPQVAQVLANEAATTFADRLGYVENLSGQGFYLSAAAEVPMRPEPSLAGGWLALVLGPLAGALLGLGLVLILLWWRQPVLGRDSVRHVTDVPVVGQVRLPHRRDQHAGATGATGAGALARRLLATDRDLVLVHSASGADAARTELCAALADLLGRVHRVRLVPGNEHDPAGPPRAAGENRTDDDTLVLVDGPSQQGSALRPEDSVQLLVVSEGMRLAELRNALADHLDDADGAGVVLVSRAQRGLRLLRRAHTNGTSASTATVTGSWLDRHGEEDTGDRADERAAAGGDDRQGGRRHEDTEAAEDQPSRTSR